MRCPLPGRAPARGFGLSVQVVTDPVSLVGTESLVSEVTVACSVNVPVAEVDHWVDLPADLAAHLFAVAHRIAEDARRVGRVAAAVDVRAEPREDRREVGRRARRGVGSHGLGLSHGPNV